MSKQKITIEIDVPEGWVAEAFRKPKTGEWFMDCKGEVWKSDTDSNQYAYIILRKAWTPPAWMPEGAWLYKFSCDEWYLTNREPYPCSIYFSGYPGSECVGVESLAALHKSEFTPPPVNKIQIKH